MDLDHSSERTPASPPCVSRTKAWIGSVGILLLALVLLLDVWSLHTDPVGFPRAGDDYVRILSTQKRHQVVNFIVGAALHDKGVGRVSAVYIPAKLSALDGRATDKMIEGTQSAFQVRFLRQLVLGKLVTANYDPVVPTATIDAWTASGRLKTYPRKVFLLLPVKGQASDGAWVLLTDSTRQSDYVVPADDAPAGVSIR